MILSAQWFCTETGAAIRIVMLPCPVPSFTLLWAEGRPSFRKFVKRGTPGWRFNLYTLQLNANSGAPDILASRVHWCNNCRKKRNKQVKQVDYTFFRDFSKLNYLSSIRPGSSAGDPQVVDLRCLQYLPDGSMSTRSTTLTSGDRSTKTEKEQSWWQHDHQDVQGTSAHHELQVAAAEESTAQRLPSLLWCTAWWRLETEHRNFVSSDSKAGTPGHQRNMLSSLRIRTCMVLSHDRM